MIRQLLRQGHSSDLSNNRLSSPSHISPPLNPRRRETPMRTLHLSFLSWNPPLMSFLDICLREICYSIENHSVSREDTSLKDRLFDFLNHVSSEWFYFKMWIDNSTGKISLLWALYEDIYNVFEFYSIPIEVSRLWTIVYSRMGWQTATNLY